MIFFEENKCAASWLSCPAGRDVVQPGAGRLALMEVTYLPNLQRSLAQDRYTSLRSGEGGGGGKQTSGRGEKMKTQLHFALPQASIQKLCTVEQQMINLSVSSSVIKTLVLAAGLRDAFTEKGLVFFFKTHKSIYQSSY